MRSILFALLAAATLASGTAHAAKQGASYEAKVSAALRKKGYSVTAKQVQLRGMGVRMPGKPQSGMTKVWWVNTKKAVLSGRITFDSRGRARVTISDTTKRAL